MVRERLGLVAVLVGSLALGACREHTVDLGFRPDRGAAYTYRYEIEAVVTRSLEGEEPEVTELDTVLLVDQEVLETSADGARVEVEIRRDGGPPRNAVVVLDRAGSLQGIEAIEGLASEALVASSSLLGPTPGLPDRRLVPGATWSIEEEGRTGSGRVERLGVIDDADVAEVRTTTDDEVREQVDAGGSTAELQGEVSSRSTTSYDLGDGAIRRSTTASVGELAVRIAPPAGIDAVPVDGTISYDVRVRVTRVR